MIVVSDTSPINYLVLIAFHDLLPKLFDLVLIPEAVQRELQAGGTPEPVRQFGPAQNAGPRGWHLHRQDVAAERLGDGEQRIQPGLSDQRKGSRTLAEGSQPRTETLSPSSAPP